jgi:hypothetical protein
MFCIRESTSSTHPYLLSASSFSALSFLRPPCSRSRESGVFEPTPVIWRPAWMSMNQVSKKCAYMIARALLHRWFHRFTCVGSTISRFSDLPFVSRNSNPVLRSIIRLSCLCSSTRINFYLCSTCVIHVNYNYIVLCVLVIKLILCLLIF